MPATSREHPAPPLPILGIDFGERRIGLAISDRDGKLALPLETVSRDTDRRAVYRIADLARARQVASLVAGEPRLLDGTVAARAERIARFARKLARVLGCPLFLVEETLTTHAADDRLDEGRGAPAAGDPRRDMVAAQILVEEALAGAARRHREEAAV